jgi:hypothetical protein
VTGFLEHPLLRSGPARRRWADLALIALLVLAGAGALQLFWIGADPYGGPGPAAKERWFYSACLAATLLLSPWSAVRAERTWARLRQERILRELQLTRMSPAAICARALAAAVAPLLAALLLSLLSWLVLSLATGSPALRQVALGHALVLGEVLALGLAGQALAALLRHPGLAGPMSIACFALGAGAILLIEPLLTKVARPEWWIAAALAVNPLTANGAALGLDVLRTPWIYSLTSAPEYRFTYPSPWLTLAFYGALALALGTSMCRRIRYE